MRPTGRGRVEDKMRTCDGHFRDHVTVERHNVSSWGSLRGMEGKGIRNQQLSDTSYVSGAHKIM